MGGRGGGGEGVSADGAGGLSDTPPSSGGADRRGADFPRRRGGTWLNRSHRPRGPSVPQGPPRGRHQAPPSGSSCRRGRPWTPGRQADLGPPSGLGPIRLPHSAANPSSAKGGERGQPPRRAAGTWGQPNERPRGGSGLAPARVKPQHGGPRRPRSPPSLHGAHALQPSTALSVPGDPRCSRGPSRGRRCRRLCDELGSVPGTDVCLTGAGHRSHPGARGKLSCFRHANPCTSGVSRLVPQVPPPV